MTLSPFGARLSICGAGRELLAVRRCRRFTLRELVNHRGSALDSSTLCAIASGQPRPPGRRITLNRVRPNRKFRAVGVGEWVQAEGLL